jgi:hypothetical protein
MPNYKSIKEKSLMNCPIARKPLFLLLASLLTTGAWAGPPGENTHGSTTTTVSAHVDDFSTCLVSAHAISNDSDTGVSASALADAISNISVAYVGDLTLDLVRHGENGSVHQVDLIATMGNGTLYAQVAQSNTAVGANVNADASSAVDATAGMIAQAVATLFQGIDFDIDLVVTSITVKAGSEALTEVNMESDAYAESSAVASSWAQAYSETSASASAMGGSASGGGSSFYVQGANIEEFEAQLSMTSGALVDVQTDVLAQTYADAIATSLAYALAEASVWAEANSQLSFVYDLPIIGSGSLPIVSDYDSATDAAQQIVNAAEAISAHAVAMAESSAKTIAGSTVDMNLSVQFENLPGTNDLLVANAAGNFDLTCSLATVSADADAQAEAF